MARTPLTLAALATTAIPGLNVVGTRGPQHTIGDFQTTGLVDAEQRHWVVRCPLTASAGAALEAETALLANLAPVVDDGELPFAVPRPAGFAALPEGGRAMVFRQLPGRPLDLDELTAGPGLSAELGRAIAALHELDPAVVADAGLPVYDADGYRTRCLAEVDEAARTGHVPSDLLNRWEHALEDVALWRFRTTPVHGDLIPENVLVAEGKVSAMLSFASVHVGDPAEDLAWLMASAPLDSLDSIEEAYRLARTEGADTALLDRAVLVSELAVARWLLHGVRHEEPVVVTDAAEMLRTLAEQVADEPPIGHREPPVVPSWGGRGDAPDADADGTTSTPADEEADVAATDADGVVGGTAVIEDDVFDDDVAVDELAAEDPADEDDEDPAGQVPQPRVADTQSTDELDLPDDLDATDSDSDTDGDDAPPSRD